MSTNNSNNSSNGTIYISGSGGGGGGATSGNFTVTIPSGWFTVGPWIDSTSVKEPAKAKKKDKDGCDCKKCKEYFPYAEPNQEDGTLICYACRHGY